MPLTDAPIRVFQSQDARSLVLDDGVTHEQIVGLFSELRPEMKRLVEQHLDRRLRQRIDASDVVQSAFIDVHERLRRYLAERPMAVRPWLFFLAKMKTLETNRHHLASQRRNAGRETDQATGGFEVQDRATSPSLQLSRKETHQRLREAIGLLPEHYREVIQLRHMRGLSNQEACVILGVSPNAASKLYIRALNTLQKQLAD